MYQVELRNLRQGSIFHFSSPIPYPSYLCTLYDYYTMFTFQQLIEYEWYLERQRYPEALGAELIRRNRERVLCAPEMRHQTLFISKYYTDIKLGTFTIYDTLEI